jgi:hypothetical protein
LSPKEIIKSSKLSSSIFEFYYLNILKED